YGDKIPAEKKAPIEAALNKLKEAHKSGDLSAIDAASAELNTVFQAASQEMYNAGAGQAGAQGGPQAGPQQGPSSNAGSSSSSSTTGNGDNVTDVDYEEVK
ncbi:MAG: molecular chaperone DnaK, partial [Bacteroidales bacterium]|nr:molecular chaperone DnaK [Bacteroidales bacterium]